MESTTPVFQIHNKRFAVVPVGALRPGQWGILDADRKQVSEKRFRSARDAGIQLRSYESLRPTIVAWILFGRTDRDHDILDGDIYGDEAIYTFRSGLKMRIPIDEDVAYLEGPNSTSVIQWAAIMDLIEDPENMGLAPTPENLGVSPETFPYVMSVLGTEGR